VHATRKILWKASNVYSVSGFDATGWPAGQEVIASYIMFGFKIK
jgi:hypothetical protein